MTAVFYIKERDKQRYAQGEIVTTSLQHWIQPLVDELNKATNGGYRCREPYMSNEGTEDVGRFFPELSIHRRFVRHYSSQFMIYHMSDTERPYFLSLRMGDHKKAVWHPTLTVYQRSYDTPQLYPILYQRTWTEDDVTFPREGVFSFYPLTPLVLAPLIRDGIRQGYLPKDEQHLRLAGAFSDEMNHVLRTLQGLQRKYNNLVKEAL